MPPCPKSRKWGASVFREFVVTGSARKLAALGAAVALGITSAPFVASRSDAAPARSNFLMQATDVWSGDWQVEGQNQQGGPFTTFGVITFELVDEGGNDVNVCLHDEPGNLHYAGSYDYGGGGTVSGCSSETGTLYGKYYSQNYFTSGGTWGAFLIEIEGDSWSGCYSPPSDNPLGTECTLQWRGERAETQTCEAPTSNQTRTTRKARFAQTPKELARPFPIEGDWAICGQDVRVTPGSADGSFVGTALGPFEFRFCSTSYVAGQQIWNLTIQETTPTSTLYEGTATCDGEERFASWQVTLGDRPSSDTLRFCAATPTGGEDCFDHFRTKQASRRFRVTLNGNPNEPMNAISVDRNGGITPGHPLYLTTNGTMTNVGFNALWHAKEEKFHKFSKPTGTLILEDVFFVGHRDETTKLKLTEFQERDADVGLDPGRDATNEPPYTKFFVEVKVVSSEWRGCPDGARGIAGVAWNAIDRSNNNQRVDALTVGVCDRLLKYKHHVPDDQSKVDIELHEVPPGS